MKTRQSGMPPEQMWQQFFDPQSTLLKLGLTPKCKCVVEFGCGYGTFSLPAAQIVHGDVYALDIDPVMVETTHAKAKQLGLVNVKVLHRDFVEAGCGLADEVADYVMLFNILHAQEAPMMLAEAKRVLRAGGTVGVMHWNYDPSTPRGPSMDIRLKPEECLAIVERAGLSTGKLLDLPPYHYGFAASKTDNHA
jgi:ubiquinone/menaquinone biosynthesis C-methylase UbiE